ncbi:MAG: ABC-type multidrug transport system ATPase subunit [Pseudohongiellaceae bacterium]|jgi:ABC-type multidrug transport system ATPase subunit
MTALRIQSLCKRFGRTVAVQDVSLNVERGQLYGLLGPNGAGKTTTLSCALGLQRPDAGSISVLGVPAAQIHRLAGKVAVVFDQPTLVRGLTVAQNLAYAQRLLGHKGGRTPAEALKLAGIADLAQRRAGRLSLGQSRRLAIARALMGRPEFLILDEPLSGLDTLGVTSMLALFADLRDQGMTLMLSSHRLHELERIVTHVGVLIGGRVVREATLPEILHGVAGQLRVTVDDVPRARTALEGLGGVVLGRSDEARGILRLDPGPSGAPAITRTLVEAGCAVSAIEPRRSGLQSAFETLLEEYGTPETERP